MTLFLQENKRKNFFDLSMSCVSIKCTSEKTLKSRSMYFREYKQPSIPVYPQITLEDSQGLSDIPIDPTKLSRQTHIIKLCLDFAYK